MKHSKAVYVTANDIIDNLTREYDVYTNKIGKSHEDDLELGDESNKDFSCQYNNKKDTLICTCKRKKQRESRYFSTSRQVYRTQRYSSAKGITEIGVGSVKTLPKRRIRKIYLQETNDRGVGSDLFTFTQKRTRDWTSSYYDQKKTSSKCVGGVMGANTSVLSKKLSPIFQTKSGTTSPKEAGFEQCKDNVNRSILQDEVIKIVQDIQVKKNEKHNEQKNALTQEYRNYTIQKNLTNVILPPVNKIKSMTRTTAANAEKYFSSDSLIQHVHNLENPSSYIQSKTSIELLENKLEREYRKFFSTKPKVFKPSAEVKPMQNINSASILRRRFEALRCGFGKKEGSKKDCTAIKTSSQTSVASKKDVSIASDPPSLEARSYSNTKFSSPIASPIHQYKTTPYTPYRKSVNNNKEDCSHWSTDAVDSDYQSAKGMFKLWGKKFNLEEDYYKKSSPSNSSDVTKKQKKKVGIILPNEEVLDKEKKEVKRFSFFKRKRKDKSKQPFKSKKGVTAGRCEVGDGFMIKIGAANEIPPEVPIQKCEQIPDEYNDILRKAWLKRFLANKIDSRNSVQIRWNNDMYATSSSTVFDLMECVYKNTGIVFRSKSGISAGNSFNRYPTQPLVNFMQQSIEAWMIPKMIIDKKHETLNICNQKKQKKKNIEVSFSSQKWFIDKSKAFSQNIELVVHSNNLLKTSMAESSDYIMIDIPKGYFSKTSSDNELLSQTSDEQVFNIVEYETVDSSSYLKKKKKYRLMDTGDHEANDIYVTVSVKNENNESKILETVIKRPPLHRDVVVQGSNVYLPKRCDVIGVGIITQRDIRDIKKPILKMREEITDDESTHTLPPQKKCELAESYLQDYYRHCTPLGIDLFSWCVSDSHLRGSSDNNSINSFNNQGDGSKSCPNIYDDYQASTIVSSCATSSCSHCMAIEDEKKVEKKDDTNFFSKFKRKLVEDKQLPTADGKRVLPKDSLEVFKRRKIYAASNKSKWGVNDDRSEPYSVPSNEDKSAQNTFSDGPKIMKPCCRPAEPKNKKSCKKHVSLQDCDVMNEILKEQLTDKMVEGILSFKGAAGCDICKKKEPEFPKHAHVIPTPICEMPQPPCIEACTKNRRPPCSKKNSPTCNVPIPPACPKGPHSTCQTKSCPPSPPPCAFVPPFLQTPRSPSLSPPLGTPPRSPLWSPLSKSPMSTSPRRHTKSPVLFPRSPACNTPPRARQKPISPRHYSPQASTQRLHPPCNCPKKKSPCRLPQCPSINKPTPYGHEHTTPCPPSPPCGLQPVVKSPPFDKCNKNSSHTFPWPKKNQQSKTPSPKESGMNLKMSPKCPTSLSPSNCATALKRLIQKFSNSSMKNKECRPDCANMAKVTKQHHPPPPPPPPSTKKSVPPVNTKSQPKMIGVHLKKMPQNSSNECESCCNEGVIRLNSKENITIKRKTQTPSTEEIRESCNIKVQDEDGQTLYERRDYKNAPGKTRTHLVKDMYRDSQIQRVSTSNMDMVITEKDLQPCESKSNTSLSIIEINFNLKFKQGDNSTEVNVKNCGDTPKEIQNKEVNDQHGTPKDVYVVKDEAKSSLEESEKKDVDIKIVIKSYQKNSNKSKRTTLNCVNLAVDDSLAVDDFSRKISEKFHTVSTGYSDVLEQQTYSVHRTKINLVNSSDICKLPIKRSEELVNEELIEREPINLTDCESIAKHSACECSLSLVAACNTENEDNLLISDISQNKISRIILGNKMETNNDKSITGISTSDKDEPFISDVIEQSGIEVNKIRNKERKKKILKEIFENSNDTKKNPKKSKMQSIRQMLRAVLTSDSSGYEDVPVHNELAKELTYASLKPNFFKDSNSMTNYYKLDDSISIITSSENKFNEVLYPTEQNSEYSDDSNKNINDNCLCSHLAAKLKIHENNNFKACCCRCVDKKDEEIGCNLTDEDIRNLNHTIYVDAQTQDSKYLSNKLKTSIVNIPKKSQEVMDRKIFKNDTEIAKKIFSYSSSVKAGPPKKINRQTILGISEDDKVIVLHSNFDRSQSEVNDIYKKINPLDIFQLHETKRAVLEIYAEKTVSDEGERTVARLPKFVYNRESALCDDEESVDGFQHMSRRNIMTSITR